MADRREEAKERAMLAGCVAVLVVMAVGFALLAVRALDIEGAAHEEWIRGYRAGLEAVR